MGFNDEEFAGKFMAFKDDDTLVDSTSVLMQLTDVDGPEIELAFNAPLKGQPRIYVRFKLPELMAHLMSVPKEKK
jgi:uncharacterized protein YfaP (DUF2135 family)